MSELTTTESLQFLENVLHMESPMNRLQADRVAFLAELIQAFLYKIPFQSVSLVATPEEHKHVPTFDEIKANMFARHGGLCFELNYFMKVLMVTLGYEAYSIAGNINHPGNHVLTIVKNLTSDKSTHLVDVGLGIPMFLPIPLDFQQESPECNSSFMPYKFIKSDKGTFWLMLSRHVDDDCADQPVHGWIPFAEFTTKHVGLERLVQNVTLVYTGPKTLPKDAFPFSTSARAMDFRHDRLVAIKDKSLLLEDADGLVGKTKLANQEEWLQAYDEYFPQFSRDLLEKVLKNIDLFGSQD
ncbi:uncharacterized acetyltransferase YvcN-like [Asterias amurensis]|uniref:uncharacterized acetyltransferase YvcN-like n=1 Tax=Asterias amurensis TaxID=7602 RepID=UPI003AB50009